MTKKNTLLSSEGAPLTRSYLPPVVEVTQVSVERGFGDSIPVGDFDDNDA